MGVDSRYRGWGSSTHACVCIFGGKYDCSHVDMAWLELGPIIFGGIEGIIDHLRQHNLLATQKSCQRCTVSMRERPRDDVSDK